MDIFRCFFARFSATGGLGAPRVAEQPADVDRVLGHRIELARLRAEATDPRERTRDVLQVDLVGLGVVEVDLAAAGGAEHVGHRERLYERGRDLR